MKRLAIYLDGTWDAPAARTNVYQLYALTAGSDGQDPQLSFYQEGVGTRLVEWLQGECGLVFDGPINLAGDEVELGLTDSFSSFLLRIYRLVRVNRRFYREIGREPSPTPIGDGISHPLNETIDGSVFDRCREPSLKYGPPNLTAWAEKHGQDLTALHGTIPARPSDLIQFL